MEFTFDKLLRISINDKFVPKEHNYDAKKNIKNRELEVVETTKFIRSKITINEYNRN